MAEQNVTTKFKVDISDLKKGIADANKSIKLANAEFKNATAGLDNWSKSADGLTAKIKQQNAVVEAEKKKLDLLKQELDRLNKSQKDGEKIVADLSAKYDEAVKTYGATSDEAKKYAKQLAEAEAAQERNAKAAEDLNLKIINQDTAVKTAAAQVNKYEKELAEMQDGLNDDEKAAKGADNALEDMSKSTKKAGDSAKSASGGGFTVLKGVLANLTTEIIDGAIKALKNLGSQITSVVTDAAATGDEIDKMSQKIGLSREAYQEWDYILSQSGVEITSLESGFKKLTNSVDDAQNGSKGAVDMFKKLGLSVDDLNKMTREEVFERVVASMQSMADTTERAALANDLFGKSGQELAPLFNTTAAATEQLKNNAHELGMIMSDDAVTAAVNFTDSMDTLKRATKGLTNNLAGEFLPGISDIMENLSDVITGNAGLDGLFDQVEEILEKAIPKIVDVLVKLGDSIAKLVKKAAPRIIKILNENLPKIIKTLLSLAGQIAKAILQAAPDIIRSIMQILSDVLIMLAEELPNIVQTIVDIIPELVQALTDPEMLNKLLNGAVTLLMAIVDAIPIILEALLDALPTIVDNLCKFLLDPKTLEQLGKAAFTLFLKLPFSMLKMLPELIKSLGEVVGAIVVNLSEPVKEIFSGMWDNLTDTFSGVGDWFGDKFKGAWKAVKDAFSGVGEFFDGVWTTIKDKFTTIGSAVGDAVSGAFKAVINSVITIVEDTINDAIDTINGAIKIINKIPGVDIGTINDVEFPRLAKGGIVSNPTFAEIGEDGAEAVVPLEKNAGGLRKIAGLIASEMKRSGDLITGNGGRKTVNNYNFTQTNNSPKALSRYEIYRQTKNLINAAKGV